MSVIYIKYKYTMCSNIKEECYILDSTCNKPITDLEKPCNGQVKGRGKRSAKCNKNADTYESTGKDNHSKRYI